MTQSAEQILSETALYSDGVDYRLLRLPAGAITLAAGVVAEAALPFSALIIDKDEVTLLLPAEARDEFSRRLRRASEQDRSYRLITFESALEPDLVGFLARISAALAAEKIPILSLSAYSRDHIFVAAHDFERAMSALQRLQQDSG